MSPPTRQYNHNRAFRSMTASTCRRPCQLHVAMLSQHASRDVSTIPSTTETFGQPLLLFAFQPEFVAEPEFVSCFTKFEMSPNYQVVFNSVTSAR